jgi:NTE family protein
MTQARRERVEGNSGKRRIAIACQGGGSHTAFTAGALRTILRKVRDERHYEIVALSGTSGGAVCAFLAWYAMLEEDNEQKAIEALRSFWEEDNAAYLKVGDPESVADVLANDFLSASTLVRRFGETTLGVGFTPELNPYRYHNLFDYWRNRLKEAIEKNVRQIDPKATEIDRAIERRVNASNRDPKLFVGAVNTLTGDFRVFKSHKKKEGEDLTFNDDEEDRVGIDAVLASAAIPTVFEATRTGEAVYWDPSRPPDERAYLDEGVYWDGLYSQNPPVRDLTEADPHEIWVIQINPEEIGQEPKRAAEIEDRRNELSGNTSLNQELYFVRKINELVKRLGKWEYDHDEIPRKVFRVPPPAGEEGHEKKYGTIKVRRVELSMPLDVASKLDRSRSHIEELMKHGSRQAELFLTVVASQIAFEQEWEEILRDKERNLDAVLDSFSEEPTIELVPSADPSSGRPSRTHGWKAEGPEKVRAVLEWCRSHNFTLEQSRDYHIDDDGPGAKVVTCWALATAGHFGDAIKGRAEVAVREGKVERFAFYPLSSKAMHKLKQELEELDNKAASG